jgi:hypothetical protein
MDGRDRLAPGSPAAERAARLAALLALLLLAGCGTTQWYPSGRPDFRVEDPERAVVVVFTHGAGENEAPDPCMPGGGALWGGYAVPAVLAALPEAMPEVRVLALCDGTTGNDEGLEAEKYRLQPCVYGYSERAIAEGNRENYGTLKVCSRMAQIVAAVERLLAENPGLTADRIFLSGTSTGAWASLLIQAQGRLPIAGVIAFAPAFSGHIAKLLRSKPQMAEVALDCGPLPRTVPLPVEPETGRRSSWALRQACHMTYLAAAQPDALVFAFWGDPYEDPHTLAALLDAPEPRILLVNYPAEDDGGATCGSGRKPHSCNHRDAFVRDQLPTIVDYMHARLLRELSAL